MLKNGPRNFKCLKNRPQNDDHQYAVEDSARAYAEFIWAKGHPSQPLLGILLLTIHGNSSGLAFNPPIIRCCRKVAISQF